MHWLLCRWHLGDSIILFWRVMETKHQVLLTYNVTIQLSPPSNKTVIHQSGNTMPPCVPGYFCFTLAPSNVREWVCMFHSAQSSAKIAWVWTQKTLANNARRYSSRCVRAFRLASYKATGPPLERTSMIELPGVINEDAAQRQWAILPI